MKEAPPRQDRRRPPGSAGKSYEAPTPPCLSFCVFLLPLCIVCTLQPGATSWAQRLLGASRCPALHIWSHLNLTHQALPSLQSIPPPSAPRQQLQCQTIESMHVCVPRYKTFSCSLSNQRAFGSSHTAACNSSHGSRSAATAFLWPRAPPALLGLAGACGGSSAGSPIRATTAASLGLAACPGPGPAAGCSSGRPSPPLPPARPGGALRC